MRPKNLCSHTQNFHSQMPKATINKFRVLCVLLRSVFMAVEHEIYVQVDIRGDI